MRPQLWWLQASNILGVQSKPFSPDTHVFEPDEYEDPVRCDGSAIPPVQVQFGCSSNPRIAAQRRLRMLMS